MISKIINPISRTLGMGKKPCLYWVSTPIYYPDNKKLKEKLYDLYHDDIYMSSFLDVYERLSYIYKNILDISEYSILDIGCNIGTYSFLSYYNNAKSIVGIDLNLELIKIANETKEHLNLSSNIEFIREDVFNLDFSTIPCDIILFFGSGIPLENKFNLYMLFCKICKYNKYLLIANNRDNENEIFNDVLVKFNYKNITEYNDDNIILIYKNQKNL